MRTFIPYDNTTDFLIISSYSFGLFLPLAAVSFVFETLYLPVGLIEAHYIKKKNLRYLQKLDKLIDAIRNNKDAKYVKPVIFNLSLYSFKFMFAR